MSLTLNEVKNSFNQNYKKLLLSFVLYLLVSFILMNIINYIDPKLKLSPHVGMHPIFGLMFGPWGAIGTSLGDFIYDFSEGYSLSFCAFDFIIHFLYGYLPFKLWYSFSKNKKDVGLPRFDSVYNFLKFIAIMLFSSIIYSLLVLILFAHLQEISLDSLKYLNFLLNSFLFSFIVGVIAISINNLTKKDFCLPKVETKFTLNPKYYNLFLVLGFVFIGIFYSIYSNNMDAINTYLDTVIFVFALCCFYLYLFKPIRWNIKREEEIYAKVIEKIILIFFFYSLEFVVIVGVAARKNILAVINGVNLSISILLYTIIILVIFYIPGISVLSYIERHLTDPISAFSKSAKDYLIAKTNGENDNKDITLNYDEYINDGDEIGLMAESFIEIMGVLDESIENLKRIAVEKERISTELNLAKNIQESILPKNSMSNTSFGIEASMVPAKEVGGDFYDFFMIDENRLAIVIGDASGKGTPAALFTVITKTLINSMLLSGKSPAEAFTSTNNQLCENNEESMFVTAWAGILELDSGKLTFVNAGHNSPLMKSKDAFEWMDYKHSLVLGAMEGIQYKENVISIPHGTQIYLYTDGITEAHNEEDELFGEDRLINILNDDNLSDIKDFIPLINRNIDDFKRERDQFDDMTMLILEYK